MNQPNNNQKLPIYVPAHHYDGQELRKPEEILDISQYINPEIESQKQFFDSFDQTNLSKFMLNYQASNLHLQFLQQQQEYEQQKRLGFVKKARQPSSEQLLKALRSNPQSFENLAENARITPQIKTEQQQIQEDIQIKEEDNLNLQKIKSNVKNTYIKKITSLLNINKFQVNEEQQQQQLNFQNSDDSDDEFDKNDDKEIRKDDKTKESAKNSRLRKKLYIELLEKKVVQLSQEIEETFKNIEENRSQLGNIFDQNDFLSAFILKRHQYFLDFTDCIQNEKLNQNQLGLILDSYHFKMNAQGKMRLKSLNNFFDCIASVFLKSNFQYFLFGHQINDNNEDNEFNRCVEIFRKTVGLQPLDENLYKVLPTIQAILNHRKKYRNIIMNLRKIQQNLYRSTSKIENLTDSLFSNLDPLALASLITKIDQN